MAFLNRTSNRYLQNLSQWHKNKFYKIDPSQRPLFSSTYSPLTLHLCSTILALSFSLSLSLSLLSLFLSLSLSLSFSFLLNHHLPSLQPHHITIVRQPLSFSHSISSFLRDSLSLSLQCYLSLDDDDAADADAEQYVPAKAERKRAPPSSSSSSSRFSFSTQLVVSK